MNNLETIADRVKPPEGAGVLPEWVQDRDSKGETIDILLGTEGPEVAVDVLKKPLEGVKAKRFLELLKTGEKPHLAAKRVGTTLGEILEKQGVRAAMKDLLEGYSVNNVVRKEVVRAAFNKVLMQNIDGDLKEQKLAVAAAKEIAKDPDVGLNVPPSTTSISIDVTALNKLSQNLEPIEGLENIFEEKK